MTEYTIKLSKSEVAVLTSESRRLADTYGLRLSSVDVIHVLIRSHKEQSLMCPHFKDADREWFYHWLADME